jgi:hypothetical protein
MFLIDSGIEDILDSSSEKLYSYGSIAVLFLSIRMVLFVVLNEEEGFGVLKMTFFFDVSTLISQLLKYLWKNEDQLASPL